MKPPMRETAIKITRSLNGYGDFTEISRANLPCHFRNITSQVAGGGDETVESDALAWFEAGSGVVRNDILIIDGEGWRVERLTKARRLRDNSVQFIKTELLRYGVIS